MKGMNAKKLSSRITESDLADRVLRIPTATFTRIIIRAGLPAAEARELCLIHKKLST